MGFENITPKVDAVAVDLVGAHPGHRVGIRARQRLAARGPADVVDDDEVIADPAGLVAMHTVEGLDDRAELHIESRLLPDFPAHGIGQRLTQIEQSARQRPLALPRLMRALDDQRLAVAHHHRADANDRMVGIFTRHGR